MTAIDQAIVLAAGAGTRLRASAMVKPLCQIAGRALLDHALTGLAAIGIARVIVVTGYEAEAVETHLARRGVTGPLVDVVRTPDWRLPNGVSVLAAAEAVRGSDSLLVMADHLVAPALYARVAAAGTGQGLTLGIDRRIGHPWVDEEDVTRVATIGDRIRAIRKGLEPFDAYDTGVFAVGPALFETLAGLRDPSLSDAVRHLAMEGAAGVVDILESDWIDVDDPRSLAIAENWLGRRGVDHRIRAA